MTEQESPRRGEEGQGLAYVLIVSSVLLVLLMALVSVIWNEARWLVGSKKRGILIQGADAAIDRALYKIQAGTNWDNMPLAGYDGEFTYTDIPGIRYRIRVQEGNWTPYDAKTMGAETTYTPTNVKSERTIIVFASYTVTGEQKKIYAIVTKSKLNSAIFTEGVLGIGGSADVYWGPVISYETSGSSIEIAGGKNECTPPSHPIYYAAGGIILGKTEAKSCAAGVWSSDPYAGQSVASYYPVGNPPELDLDYYRGQAKSWTLSKGVPAPYNKRYYFSGAQLWNFNAIDPGAKNEWPSYMNPGDSDTGVQPTVIFFDTCDGSSYNSTPSKASKGAGCPDAPQKGVNVGFGGGGSACGQGVLIVMGNASMQGGGSCPLTPAQLPADCQKKGGPCTDTNSDGYYDPGMSGHYWEGMLWAQGKFSSSGNKKIYGTLGAGEATLASDITGSFEVWFKSNNASIGALGQTVLIRYWREAKGNAGDVFP